LTVADIPQGYREVPEENRKKAQAFFDRGNAVAGTGNYEYAIEMYLQGLAIDPEARDAHQNLREISLKRKASGGKDLGMFEKMKFKAAKVKDDHEAMLKAVKLMSYDPGNPDNMLSMMKAAHKAGYYDSAIWVAGVMIKANSELKSPDVSKYLAARDMFIDLKLWQKAVEACQYAVAVRPDDMDLARVLKDLGAQLTLSTGGYEGGSFRDSVRDMGKQTKLMQADMDVRDEDILSSQIRDAEAELAADPDEPGKVTKLVDLLLKTEQMEAENRAIELLQQWFEKTKQFRFRLTIGKIKMTQLRRQERSQRIRVKQLATAAESKDPAAVEEYTRAAAEYKQFLREKAEDELKEFQLFSDNYPTDMSFKFELGARLFVLEQFTDAIALFQQSRSDPKLRADASTYLGRAFLHAGYAEEAVETLKQAIEDYEVRGDNKSKELFYWYGLALEKKGDTATAMKNYSQLVQWDFNYRDVQARIKRLRGKGSADPVV
jgi:tetratricopeptide (TPR) repeat protein